MRRFQISKMLRKLAESDYISAKEIEQKSYFAETLNFLIETNALKREPGRRGSWRYTILAPEKIEKLIEEQYVLYADKPANFTASDAVGLMGDAHKSDLNCHDDITLRIVNNNVVLRHVKTDEKLDYEMLSKLGSALTIRLSDWEIEADTALTVENHQFFWEAENVLKTDIIFYTAGQFSNNFLDWLSSEAVNVNKYIHAGDYDISGLSMFMRLKNAIAEYELFVPENLDYLIRHFGNKDRLTKQTKDMDSVNESEDSCVRLVLKIIVKYGKTLDQEALLNPMTINPL